MRRERVGLFAVERLQLLLRVFAGGVVDGVIDSGLATGAFADLVASFGAYIDFVKLGWGTALVTPRLEEKMACLEQPMPLLLLYSYYLLGYSWRYYYKVWNLLLLNYTSSLRN